MADDLTSRLLSEQRKRFIASVMGAAETANWWGKLNPAEQRQFRDKILSSVGTFYDFCRDVVKVTGEDSIRNDAAVELLRRVHEGQQQLEATLRKNGRASTAAN